MDFKTQSPRRYKLTGPYGLLVSVTLERPQLYREKYIERNHSILLLGRYFERYRLHLKVFWEGESYNFITDGYDGEALCQATMLQSSRQKGRKGERNQRGNSNHFWEGEEYRSKFDTWRNINFPPGSCVYTHFSATTRLLMCNRGRKQVIEDAKELVKREFPTTPRRKQSVRHYLRK